MRFHLENGRFAVLIPFLQHSRLQLNINKLELLWCATARWQHQLPRCPFRIWSGTVIQHFLLLYFQSPRQNDGTRSNHEWTSWKRRVVNAIRAKFQGWRRSVPSYVYQSLVVALVLSPLDCGNATLAGLPACLLNSTVSSLSSTRQLGRSPVFVARSILQMPSPVFTGCEHPSASSSNWRSLSTMGVARGRGQGGPCPIPQSSIEWIFLT